MVEKVNGTSFPTEALTGNMDFFVLRTTLNITPTGDITSSSQRRFDQLVEVISLRAQPVIIGAVVSANETAPIADLPVTGSAPYTPGDTVPVYSVRFSIEHEGAWDNVDISLLDELHGREGFVYTVPSDANNVSLKKSDFMDL